MDGLYPSRTDVLLSCASPPSRRPALSLPRAPGSGDGGRVGERTGFVLRLLPNPHGTTHA